MLICLLLALLFEDWMARRKLKAHIRVTAGTYIEAAESAMQLQHEQFVLSQAEKQRSS